MQYQLMHREQPVAALEIDEELGVIMRVGALLRPEHLPVGLDPGRPTFRADLNAWFSGRAIPAGRSGLQQALLWLETERGMELTPNRLLLHCYGLSLSDQYWVSPLDAPLAWSQVNFYDNPFSDDLGNILLGQAPCSETLDLFSPCSTLDGWLPKKWKISRGGRMLVKGGSGTLQQEPFNELVASAVCRRLAIPYVPYSILWENGKPYSACPDLTTNREDLVSAYYINRTQKRRSDRSAFEHFLACCDALGIPDARQRLQQMLVLDYLIGNTDRHFGNFGAIRDAVTLEWKGFAPIFDSGSSLWYAELEHNIHPLGTIAAKPFRDTHHEQIKLAADALRSLDFSALHGIREEAYAIYQQALFQGTPRAEILSGALEARCQQIERLALEYRPPVVPVSQLCEAARRQADAANAGNGPKLPQQGKALE